MDLDCRRQLRLLQTLVFHDVSLKEKIKRFVDSGVALDIPVGNRLVRFTESVLRKVCELAGSN